MPHIRVPVLSPPSTQNKGKKMTRQEFKEWLITVDANGDGKISRQELHAALKGLGIHCMAWKAWRAMVHADLDKNKGVEGDVEVDELIKYAQKRWNIIVD